MKLMPALHILYMYLKCLINDFRILIYCRPFTEYLDGDSDLAGWIISLLNYGEDGDCFGAKSIPIKVVWE